MPNRNPDSSPPRVLAVLLLAMLQAACLRAGPDYARPVQKMPEQFHESGPWKQTAPNDAALRGKWWELFGDPVLDRLEEQARAASPRLQAAAARVRQARAALGLSEAGSLPTLEVAPDIARYAVSRNRPDQPDKIPNNREYATSRFRLPLVAAYELDLWGRVARQNESAGRRLEAGVAAYQTVLLALQGDLAQTYFQLRAADAELALLKRNIALRLRAQELVSTRKNGGLASEFDLSRVETELALAESEALATEKRRNDLGHGLALLVGAAPGEFKIEPQEFSTLPPAVPVGLPADLLERRPDVAEAERLLAARNAEIGVSQASLFPAIRLTAGLGAESADLSDLLNANSRIWSLGAALVQPIFDGGRLRANTQRARELYAENLALYRERILVAFWEVEATLAALRVLDLQHETQERAAASAGKSERLATARYQAGLTNVLELIDAQRTHLQVERSKLQVRSNQLLASVALMRALGGGWEASSRR